jgi:hypothetical protein
VVGKFGPYFLRGPSEADTARTCHGMRWEDSLECFQASIVCIGHGRTARFLCKVCTKGVMDIPVWCLKLWQIMTSRFGILSLVWLDRTMISMCFSALRCFWNLWKVMLYHANMSNQYTKGYYIADGIYFPCWIERLMTGSKVMTIVYGLCSWCRWWFEGISPSMSGEYLRSSVISSAWFVLSRYVSRWLRSCMRKCRSWYAS